jgi:hypothetical protein
VPRRIALLVSKEKTALMPQLGGLEAFEKAIAVTAKLSGEVIRGERGALV